MKATTDGACIAPASTPLDRAVAASLRRQDLDRWQRDARAAGPRSGACGACGRHSAELVPAYGRWECEDCYWEDTSPRERAARDVAAELGGDPAEYLP